MRRPVGIKDVAAAAGVSITTVSHALNGKGRLTDETRARVRETAEQLGYQPSALARGLAGGRTGMLAMTVSSADDFALQVGDLDYFMQVMSAATTAALERGYALTLLPTDSNRQTLDSLPVDGGIVVDPVLDDPIVGRLNARGVPVVTLGRQPDGPEDAAWVDNDHVGGTREMLDHLAAEGAQRIALLTAQMTSSYVMDALAGYRAWCEDHGAEPLVATVRDTLSESAAYAASMELLESAQPPDAIYGTLDRLALGALLAAEAKGVSVPQDLRVAGCTDSDSSRTARPALTALSLNPEQLADEAVDLLVKLIEHDVLGDRHRVVPSVIIPRRSTRLLAGRARSGSRGTR